MRTGAVHVDGQGIVRTGVVGTVSHLDAGALFAELERLLCRFSGADTRRTRLSAEYADAVLANVALVAERLDSAFMHDEAPDPGEPRLAAAVAALHESARRAEDVVLLALAAAGPLPVRRHPLTVAELVHVLGRELALLAQGWPVAVGTVGDGGSAIVRADERLLTRAFANLVDNAVRYGAGTITLSPRVTPTSVELHLRDRGPGFTAAFLAGAFDGDGDGEAERGRRGLAVVRAIAEAHEGYAGVGNAETGGGDAWLVLRREP